MYNEIEVPIDQAYYNYSIPTIEGMNNIKNALGIDYKPINLQGRTTYLLYYPGSNIDNGICISYNESNEQRGLKMIKENLPISSNIGSSLNRNVNRDENLILVYKVDNIKNIGLFGFRRQSTNQVLYAGYALGNNISNPEQQKICYFYSIMGLNNNADLLHFLTEDGLFFEMNNSYKRQMNQYNVAGMVPIVLEELDLILPNMYFITDFGSTAYGSQENFILDGKNYTYLATGTDAGIAIAAQID